MQRKRLAQPWNPSPVQADIKENQMNDDLSRTTSRRNFLGITGAAIAGATVAPLVEAQQQSGKPPRSPDHTLPNEQQPGPNNHPLDQ